jgi:hypothetical protein
MKVYYPLRWIRLTMTPRPADRTDGLPRQMIMNDIARSIQTWHSGAVIRSTYGPGEAARENSGDLPGSLYARAIRWLVRDRSSDGGENQFQLSAASELTDA